MYSSKRISVSIGLAICLLLPSCSFSNLVAEHSVDYNRAARTVSNSNVILNVLRAKDRFPMSFTSITKITGAFKFEPSASIKAETIPFEGSTAPDKDIFGTIESSVTYTSNPSYDVAILDSQKFTNGILSPISPKILYHFLSQGWQKEILFSIFIERIDVEGGDTIYNYPSNINEFQKFLRINQLDLTRDSVSHNITSPVSLSSDIDLSDLVKMADSGYDIVEESNEYKLIKEKNRYFFCVSSGCYLSQIKEDSDYYLEDEGVDRSIGVVDGKGNVAAHITLRSVQGMIYYLGEIIREQEKRSISQICINEHGIEEAFSHVLFRKDFIVANGISREDCRWYDKMFDVVESDGKNTLPDFTFRHRDKVFGVPINARGRSTQIVELISQLIGLQKEADELPTTQTIRVVSQ